MSNPGPPRCENEKAMKILLSFTGFHDPYSNTSVEGGRQAGPILTVLTNRPFDKIVLFQTPNTCEHTKSTVEAITEALPRIAIDVLDIPLKDPTDYVGILKHLRRHAAALLSAHPDAELSISVSSGTPHMHACWMMLAASGEIPAVLLQAQPPQFVADPKQRVKEIDFNDNDQGTRISIRVAT